MLEELFLAVTFKCTDDENGNFFIGEEPNQDINCPPCPEGPEELICAKFGKKGEFQYHQTFFNKCWLEHTKCWDDTDLYKWDVVHDNECTEDEVKPYSGELLFEDVLEPQFSGENADNSKNEEYPSLIDNTLMQ